MFTFSEFSNDSAYILDANGKAVDTFFTDGIDGTHWTFSGLPLSHYGLTY